ncbi:MAG TPA: hypothetical protein VK728_03930 [Candidatus Sulfotelmatobacter sp.]|jgi:hypothetical protein|nr:hypothetical protein [Candidatus Sulfotelmatobacter sp.]
MKKALLVLALFPGLGQVSAQEPPPATGARIVIMPRKIVSGEHATLAVLDISGRLTPGVTVEFSNGDVLKTDATGRAIFVAPLNAGKVYAAIQGRTGRVASTIVTSVESPTGTQEVALAPRVASLSDRFEFMGHGFCGDADANHVLVQGLPGLVLAASPAYLAVLPPAELQPGPAQVEVSCGQKSSPAFTVVFVALELEAGNAALAPGEHRKLRVQVKGTTTKVSLEARNLAPEVAELQGGTPVRVLSTGGADNVASFELVGKRRGNFVISIRLVAPLSSPHN